MLDGIRLVTAAATFAALRHKDQTRKGEAGDPYINHLAEVADLVAWATDGRDAALVAAAFLHDVVEDTGTSGAEVRELFGGDVADLVAEATDDMSLPKAERKRLQVEHAPERSARAKMLKLADKISNVREIASSPPAGWPLQRRRDYVRWGREVKAGLGGASPRLEARFDEVAAATDAALDAEAGQG